MRVRGAIFGLVLVLVACAPADPAVHAEQQWRTCENSGIPQERVHACSVVVASATTASERKVEALIQRGVQRAAMGEYARAVADFGRALRIDPGSARAYVERGQVHYQRGEYNGALRDSEAALRIEPDLPGALSLRDIALRGAETSEGRIIDLLTRQIEMNPLAAELWNNRCWQRAIEDIDLDLALADCDEALRLDPRMAAALDSRGLVNFKRGDFAASLSDYEAALRLEPNRGHYLYGRGLARLRLGQSEAGNADLVAAERAEPGVADMYEGYGVVL